MRELIFGEGVDVVFDLIGNNIFMVFFDCLVLKGMLVSFGVKGGDVLVFNFNYFVGN